MEPLADLWSVDDGSMSASDVQDASRRLAEASATVRGFCGWHIAPVVTETVTLNPSGTRILALPTLHLTAVVSVTVAGTARTDYTWSSNGLLRSSYGWSVDRWSGDWRSIVVQITHGYATAPEDVAMVTRTLAMGMMDNPSGAEQESIAGYSYSRSVTSVQQVLTEGHKAILRRYQVPALA